MFKKDNALSISMEDSKIHNDRSEVHFMDLF
jgi:hypothetical protein